MSDTTTTAARKCVIDLAKRYRDTARRHRDLYPKALTLRARTAAWREYVKVDARLSGAACFDLWLKLTEK